MTMLLAEGEYKMECSTGAYGGLEAECSIVAHLFNIFLLELAAILI